MDWSNICKVMRYADCRNETEYQGFIKEMILEEKLGWNPSQITEQLSLQLGSTERLVPDLVVSKDDRNSFIVEVKKPGHKKTHGDIEQLLSYMKQLETPVGIYWGDEVEVYYKTIGDGSAPVLLMCLNFNVLCEDGDMFISLFSENTYCVEEVCKFKDERESKKAFDSKVNELLSEVSSLEFQEELRSFIAGHLQKRGASKDIETEVMGKISVSVTVDSGDEKSKVGDTVNQVVISEMSNKTETYLRAIGKDVFISILYPALKSKFATDGNYDIDYQDVCRSYPEYAERVESDGAKKSRLSTAKSILRNGWEREALTIISVSNRLDEKLTKMAKTYLHRLTSQE